MYRKNAFFQIAYYYCILLPLDTTVYSTNAIRRRYIIMIKYMCYCSGCIYVMILVLHSTGAKRVSLLENIILLDFPFNFQLFFFFNRFIRFECNWNLVTQKLSTYWCTKFDFTCFTCFLFLSFIYVIVNVKKMTLRIYLCVRYIVRLRIVIYIIIIIIVIFMLYKL